MTEQTEDRNPLLETFEVASNQDLEPSHQDLLTDALRSIFDEMIQGLPDGMNEEQADAWISEHMLGLLDQAFKAGMIYFANFVEQPEPVPAKPANGGTVSDRAVSLSAEEATAIITGLLSGGILLRVDRKD